MAEFQTLDDHTIAKVPNTLDQDPTVGRDSDGSPDSKLLVNIYMDSLDQNSVKEYRNLLTS
ncbi:MAG: hypothetical protein J6U12_04075, partial [Candidatus Methanomethylophilaceae archaeon]|nr:hypothetical protein [Candidatus Methanomethylophilaceae archaeon]